MKYREFIEQTLKRASGIAQEKFGKVAGRSKSSDNNQVFTEADIAIGKYIINEITRVFPQENIIVEEAGGVYTDFFGNPINYTNALNRTKETFTWCAAPPALHKKLQAIIHFNDFNPNLVWDSLTHQEKLPKCFLAYAYYSIRVFR